MDFVEVSNMDLEKESQHWWIKTRFQYIDLALSYLNRKSSINILEVGCGTGQNLAYLRNQSPFRETIGQMVGVDLHLPKSFSRPDLSATDRLTNSEAGLEPIYDLLILMDVIEHVENPVELIKSYKKFLRPGGLVLVTVPAFQSLWSQHDVILEHKKRYTKNILNQEAKECGLKPRKESYIFSAFFPAVYLIRKILPAKEGKGETDLKLPHPLVNLVCTILGIIERKLGNLLPFGTSVFGVYELDK